MVMATTRGKSGQAMIFITFVVVILAVVALWNFDLHKIVTVKQISQNAGDAAALAAARWQAITLNLIGDLNVMQAVALTAGDTGQAAEIAELQARLCYVGPMVGLAGAQQAAKNNGIFNNERYAARLERHAEEVLREYTGRGGDGRMMFPEPYPGCWTEYADMIQSVADNGVAAGPDNSRLYSDDAGGHILLAKEFYDAVAGEDWCWFFFNAYELLLDYAGFRSWPPLPPEIPLPDPMNCEYFGLGLRKQPLVTDARAVALMRQAETDRGLSGLPIDATVGSVTSAWYCYDEACWGPWDLISPVGENHFPATGLVKPQYDYLGADAAVRVQAEATRLSSTTKSRITWTAAAKPFGSLEVDGTPVKPNECGLVIPAFRDVRLIPADACSGPAGGAFDLDWRDHIEVHLPEYMASGSTVPGCWYCDQLRTWESPVFRATGVEWLKENSDSCETPGTGGRAGGGSRRGH